jgi:hypothetical protein
MKNILDFALTIVVTILYLIYKFFQGLFYVGVYCFCTFVLILRGDIKIITKTRDDEFENVFRRQEYEEKVLNWFKC